MAAVPFEHRRETTPKGELMIFDHRSIDVFVGVDMAKQDHYAQAITATGEELFHRPVLNDQAAIERLIVDAAKRGRVALVIDMPSSSAQLLLEVARDHDTPVAYVTGLQMRRAAELYAGAAKTDPRDAWVLADFARRHADQLAWIAMSDEALATLRILNGRDVDLATDVNRVINRCRDALVSISPALERVLGSQLDAGGVRDLLATCPTPTAMWRLAADGISELLTQRSPRKAKQLTAAIVKALEAQSVTLPAEQTWGEIIVGLIADLERLVEQRKRLGAQIEEVFLAHPLGAVLVTLCGFGPRTGARTLAEIGDPRRFKDGGRLAAYAGLAPIDRRSGKSINSAAASRRGNHRLKNAMFLAAFVAVRHDPNAKAYYDRKRAEGKGHNAAVICVARRRCDLIWAMLTTATAYDPHRHENLPSAA
jgi:transposase